jgi:curli biogenesis system outer membrane secretion channel CsgG
MDRQPWAPFRSSVLLSTALLALSLASCLSPSAYHRQQSAYLRGRSKPIKPVVAVMDFENRANFSGQWNLGSGMADLLVSELMDSGCVTVLERQHIGDVINEIVRQGQSLFRREGRVERGRLKNAQYLIRGVVTDFTVTSEGRGWFGVPHFRLWGSGARARVAINIKVSDVESGEILSSVKSDASVGAGGMGGDYADSKMAFGGDAFFRTPLGRATEKAMTRAVRRIIVDLPLETWKPRVAEAGLDMVVINGGENVGVKNGDLFLVREHGREITDPVTGNVLETVPGRVVSRVEVREVKPLSARAIILEGKVARGQILEPIAESTP